MYGRALYDAVWNKADGAEVSRILKPSGRLILLEADRHAETVPSGWIARSRGVWPPDAVVKSGWRRFGMDEQEWGAMIDQVKAQGMVVTRDAPFGFYRCIEANNENG